ncbi:MAG: aldehyde dehydrogenase family protein [Anaerolineaceae bacterium]|nr:aldehyde dehydrogenase family protein [Anaerolineaceae bacterium]
MAIDHDLLSIQEARNLANAAYQAQLIWKHASQEEVDQVCSAIADAAFAASAELGQMAHDETGFGIAAHKKLKNELGSRYVWESIKDIKTVGVIHHDPQRRIYDIAWPVGVIAALIPSTNPTSTAMFKAISAVKARDAIVIAPHPSAARCTYETVRIMQQAAEKAGAPANLISCMQQVSMQGTEELLKHKYVRLILATGGSAMVKAAHSVGKPAYGVGPGNVPAYVDRSADIEKAAYYIVNSKAFDCSTICASEQSVIADSPIAGKLRELMIANGAYFANEEQTDRLRKLLFYPDGTINTVPVGKPAQTVAGMAGFSIPQSARVIVTPLQIVGKDEPLSREKLTTVLGWYEEDGWEAGCERSIELIVFGGRGHTLVIHATDENVIMAFGLEKPVFRILVNTMSTLGAVGLTTGLMPSMTLGSGGEGGSITGDNINVHHLYNIKRLAYENTPPPQAALRGPAPTSTAASNSQDIETLVKQVVQEVIKQTM